VWSQHPVGDSSTATTEASHDSRKGSWIVIRPPTTSLYFTGEDGWEPAAVKGSAAVVLACRTAVCPVDLVELDREWWLGWLLVV
jgi:hypothetical protein